MTNLREPCDGFVITVSLRADQAVLGVAGELDLLSAPELAGVLDAVLDRGRTSVVLDLAELDFMDAAGLAVIAAGTGRLAASGARLVIRSPSDLVGRMLEITGLDQVVALEYPQRTSDHLGPEQSTGAPGVPVEIDPAEVAQQLRLLSIPADHDVVDGALRLVVALAQATIGGADGVSVSLQRHGRLATVAASDQTISDMDADQYATGEGPCVDASNEGRWFHVESLDTETRWPAFTPRAQELGIKAILSTPLLRADQPVGAINIYSRTTAAFAAGQQELAAVFATEASALLRDAGAGVSDEELSKRLGEALLVRQVIAQAQGAVMQREGVSAEEAFTVLRRDGDETGRTLRRQAEEVVTAARRRPIVAGAIEPG